MRVCVQVIVDVLLHNGVHSRTDVACALSGDTSRHRVLHKTIFEGLQRTYQSSNMRTAGVAAECTPQKLCQFITVKDIHQWQHHRCRLCTYYEAIPGHRYPEIRKRGKNNELSCP